MQNTPAARRHWLKSLVAILVLLPCFALVSCKDPKFEKVKLRTDSQAAELKRWTGASVPLRPGTAYGIYKYSIVIDGSDGANIVGAVAADEKGSYVCTIDHEEDKCTISWEARKNVPAFTTSFDVVFSYSDCSSMKIAYKEYITALGWATLVVGAVLMNPIVLAPLF